MGNVFEFIKDLYRYERNETTKKRDAGAFFALYSRDEPERYQDQVRLVPEIDDSAGIRRLCDDNSYTLFRRRFRYCYDLFRKLRFLLKAVGERSDFSYSAICSIYNYARRSIGCFHRWYYTVMDRCLTFGLSSGLKLEDLLRSIFIEDSIVPLLDNFNMDKRARQEYFRLRKLHFAERIPCIA